MHDQRSATTMGQWLAWAAFCYSTSYHSALRDTPFTVVYRRPHPSIRIYDQSTTRVAAVDHQLANYDEFLQQVRGRLLQAQQHVKPFYDDKHREVVFSIGDWVWLRLQHQPASSLTSGTRNKLAPRFYGPYKITTRIGLVAYRLALPPRARIHDMFHVGLLKQFIGKPLMSPPTLPPILHGQAIPTPEKVIKARLCRGSGKSWFNG